jgi:glutamine amidotransferase-like uncharacterized protein
MDPDGNQNGKKVADYRPTDVDYQRQRDLKFINGVADGNHYGNVYNFSNRNVIFLRMFDFHQLEDPYSKSNHSYFEISTY